MAAIWRPVFAANRRKMRHGECGSVGLPAVITCSRVMDIVMGEYLGGSGVSQGWIGRGGYQREGTGHKVKGKICGCIYYWELAYTCCVTILAY